jgi:hypothetical protein
VASVHRLRTSEQLIELLAPRLDAIAADANLRGSVRRRMDPLLAALPREVVLTGRACDRLHLDQHELAYVLHDSWRRASPEALLIGGFRGRGQGFARIFTEARSFAAEQEQFFEPHWLGAKGTFAVVNPELRTRGLRGGMGSRYLPLSDLTGLEPRSIFTARGLVKVEVRSARSKFAHHAEPTPCVFPLIFERNPGWTLHSPSLLYGHVDSTLPNFEKSVPLDGIPTPALECFRDLLACSRRQTSTLAHRQSLIEPDRKYERLVRSLRQAIEQVLAPRYGAASAATVRALRAFRAGELDSLVGSLPFQVVRAVAGTPLL